MNRSNERKYPDIQSIESRLQRIEDQLALYQGKSIYSITRKRLVDVKNQLERCLGMLDEILIGSGCNSNYQYSEPVVSVDSKDRDLSGDLSDLLIPDLECNLISEAEQYKPKYILSNYRKRLNELSQFPSGILQVNQVINVMNLWFQKRYSMSKENSNFKYRADRIHEWIDLVILASGYALNNKMFMPFRTEFEEWIETINTDTDRNWILPKNIMRFHKSNPSDYTEEAVLIERIIKKKLYDAEFYPSLKDSIGRIVICSGRFGNGQLTTDKILEDCKSSWLVTSTFDKTLY